MRSYTAASWQKKREQWSRMECIVVHETTLSVCQTTSAWECLLGDQNYTCTGNSMSTSFVVLKLQISIQNFYECWNSLLSFDKITSYLKYLLLCYVSVNDWQQKLTFLFILQIFCPLDGENCQSCLCQSFVFHQQKQTGILSVKGGRQGL